MTGARFLDVPFAKMNGSGNDFILVDGTDGRFAGADLADLARRLCRRKFSVGADGLIVLVPSSEADFAWEFFNSDGSRAGMCGNGARCAVRFARMRGIAKDPMTFRTGAGIIRGWTTAQGARVQMTTPARYRERFRLDLEGTAFDAWFLDTGVPHVVIPVWRVDEIDVDRLGRIARNHPAFAPEGANANFIGRAAGGGVRVRTYERGVEAETFACGTGAVAGALVAAHLGWTGSPAAVVTSGGNTLHVHFEGGWGDYREVSLEGDARLVYEGRWQEDALAET